MKWKRQSCAEFAGEVPVSRSKRPYHRAIVHDKATADPFPAMT